MDSLQWHCRSLTVGIACPNPWSKSENRKQALNRNSYSHENSWRHRIDADRACNQSQWLDQVDLRSFCHGVCLVRGQSKPLQQKRTTGERAILQSFHWVWRLLETQQWWSCLRTSPSASSLHEIGTDGSWHSYWSTDPNRSRQHSRPNHRSSVFASSHDSRRQGLGVP